MKRSIKKKFALLIFLTTALVSACVVILMNEDLNNVGYAVYEEGVDNTADDVFERADANMYADKAAQKAQKN